MGSPSPLGMGGGFFFLTVGSGTKGARRTQARPPMSHAATRRSACFGFPMSPPMRTCSITSSNTLQQVDIHHYIEPCSTYQKERLECERQLLDHVRTRNSLFAILTFASASAC